MLEMFYSDAIDVFKSSDRVSSRERASVISSQTPYDVCKKCKYKCSLRSLTSDTQSVCYTDVAVLPMYSTREDFDYTTQLSFMLVSV